MREDGCFCIVSRAEIQGNSFGKGVTMVWRRLAAAALLMHDATVAAQNVNVGKLLRFSCSQLVIERSDPIVNPGSNPSPHTHQVVGGNSFNFSVGTPPRHRWSGAGYAHWKSRWTMRPWTRPPCPRARAAPMPRTSAITGQLVCTSSLPKMARTRWYHSGQISAVSTARCNRRGVALPSTT